MRNENLKDSSDLILVQRAKENHSQAVEELINRYKSMVYTIAYNILKNREEAEEVAQDAFVRAFTKLNMFRMDSSFSTWLYRIAYNLSISRTREQKREHAYQEETKATESFEQPAKVMAELEAADRKRYLDKAMEGLVGDDRMILMLFYYDGKSVEEVSQITGYSNSNVKVKLYRARKFLYEQLSVLLKTETRQLL